MGSSAFQLFGRKSIIPTAFALGLLVILSFGVLNLAAENEPFGGKAPHPNLTFLDFEILRTMELRPYQTAFLCWRKTQAANQAQAAPAAFRLVPLQLRAFLLTSFLPLTVIMFFFFFYQISRANAGVDAAQPPLEGHFRSN